MGATSSRPLSGISRNSPPSDCPSIAPSSMLSPTSQPRLSPIRSIPCRQSLSVLLSREKLITRVLFVQANGVVIGLALATPPPPASLLGAGHRWGVLRGTRFGRRRLRGRPHVSTSSLHHLEQGAA